MSDEKKGKFKCTVKQKFDDIEVGDILPESDLCLQNEQWIKQFEYIAVEEEEEEKFEIKPGSFSFVEKAGRLVLEKFDLKTNKLLETFSNTEKIKKESDLFFNRLHIYEELGRPKKRAILLFSDPGMGKTSTIACISNNYIKEDPGTVIINWKTNEISASAVSHFLASNSEFKKECTRLILITEDIGGGEREGDGGARGVDAGLLNLLDGVDVVFKLPTFIIATTNFPDNLVGALADRPERFDELIHLAPPNADERVDLVAFISKKKLNKEQEKAVRSADGFSVAHLGEVIIRSLLHDKTYTKIIDDIKEHRKLFKDGKLTDRGRKKLGIGLDK